MKYLFLLFAVSFAVSCTKKEEAPTTPQAPVAEKVTKEDFPDYEGIDFSGTNLTRLSAVSEADDLKILDKTSGKEIDSFPKSVFGRVKFFPVKGHYVVRPHALLEIKYSLDAKKNVTRTVTCSKNPVDPKPTGDLAKFITDNGCKI